MTANLITDILTKTYYSPFYYAKQFVVVPNVSYGLLPWEADLLCCSKNGYLTEIEIKISLSDWKADLEKRKWQQHNALKLIKKFYYAAPRELAQRWAEIDMRPNAGVIAVDEGERGKIEIIRAATVGEHRRLTETEMLKLSRLGCLRYWDLRHRS
jgi:hypothetical protein